MSGDPDLATTSKAIKILDQLGADVIELGVPYSVCTVQLIHPAVYRLYCTVEYVAQLVHTSTSCSLMSSCANASCMLHLYMYVCLEIQAVK